MLCKTDSSFFKKFATTWYWTKVQEGEPTETATRNLKHISYNTWYQSVIHGFMAICGTDKAIIYMVFFALPMELTKPFFIEAVPNVDITIRTSSGKCVVAIVKSYSIDRIYQLLPIFFNSVALEGILFFLYLRIGIKVLHCHSTWICI